MSEHRAGAEVVPEVTLRKTGGRPEVSAPGWLAAMCLAVAGSTWSGAGWSAGLIEVAPETRYVVEAGGSRVAGPYEGEEEAIAAAVATLRPGYVGRIGVMSATAWAVDSGAGYQTSAAVLQP